MNPLFSWVACYEGHIASFGGNQVLQREMMMFPEKLKEEMTLKVVKFC